MSRDLEDIDDMNSEHRQNIKQNLDFLQNNDWQSKRMQSFQQYIDWLNQYTPHTIRQNMFDQIKINQNFMRDQLDDGLIVPKRNVSVYEDIVRHSLLSLQKNLVIQLLQKRNCNQDLSTRKQLLQILWRINSVEKSNDIENHVDSIYNLIIETIQKDPKSKCNRERKKKKLSFKKFSQLDVREAKQIIEILKTLQQNRTYAQKKKIKQEKAQRYMTQRLPRSILVAVRSFLDKIREKSQNQIEGFILNNLQKNDYDKKILTQVFNWLLWLVDFQDNHNTSKRDLKLLFDLMNEHDFKKILQQKQKKNQKEPSTFALAAVCVMLKYGSYYYKAAVQILRESLKPLMTRQRIRWIARNGQQSELLKMIVVEEYINHYANAFGQNIPIVPDFKLSPHFQSLIMQNSSTIQQQESYFQEEQEKEQLINDNLTNRKESFCLQQQFQHFCRELECRQQAQFFVSGPK